jgi:NADH-quinone oxidoreductase subunit N
MNPLLMDLSAALILMISGFVMLLISCPKILFKPRSVYLQTLEDPDKETVSNNSYSGMISFLVILVAGAFYFQSEFPGILFENINEIEETDFTSSLIQTSSLSKAVHISLLILGSLHLSIGIDFSKKLKHPSVYLAVILFCLGSLLMMSLVQNILLLFFLLEMSSLGVGLLITFCEKNDATKSTVRNYWMNHVVSMVLFFWGTVLLWGVGKSFDFFRLKESVFLLLGSESEKVWGVHPEYLLMGSILFMVASIGMKMGLIPFQSGTLILRSKTSFGNMGAWILVQFSAGIIVLIRLNEISFVHLPEKIQLLLLMISGVTMLIPAILAVRELEWAKSFSYMTAVHAGFLILGVASGIGTVTAVHSESLFLASMPNGIHSTVYYLFVFLLMNAGVLGVLVALEKEGYKIRYMDDFRGLYHIHPPASICLAILLIGLAGFPVTAGFWGRMFIAINSLSVSTLGTAEALPLFNPVFFVLALIFCLSSLMIAIVYFQILGSMFFQTPVKKSQKLSGQFALSSTMFAAMLTVGLGLFPSALIRLTNTNKSPDSIQTGSIQEKPETLVLKEKNKTSRGEHRDAETVNQ